MKYNKKQFLSKMLELGAQLDQSIEGPEILMTLNDASILYDEQFEEYPQPKKSDICDTCFSAGGNFTDTNCSKCKAD